MMMVSVLHGDVAASPDNPTGHRSAVWHVSQTCLSSFRICSTDTWILSYLSHILLCISFLSSVSSQCRPTSLLFPQSKASGAPILGRQVAITQFVIQDFLSPPGACFILFSWAWPSLAHLFSRPVFFPASASLPPFLSCLPKSPFS